MCFFYSSTTTKSISSLLMCGAGLAVDWRCPSPSEEFSFHPKNTSRSTPTSSQSCRILHLVFTFRKEPEGGRHHHSVDWHGDIVLHRISCHVSIDACYLLYKRWTILLLYTNVFLQKGKDLPLLKVSHYGLEKYPFYWDTRIDQYILRHVLACSSDKYGQMFASRLGWEAVQ